MSFLEVGKYLIKRGPIMISILSIFLLLLLLTIIVFIEIKRNKTDIVDSFSFFNAYFIIFYILSAITGILFNSYGIYYRGAEQFNMEFAVPIIIIIFYFSFALGYTLKPIIFSTKLEITRSKEQKILYLMFFISIVLLLLYSSGYGGILEAVKKAAAIRSGYVDAHRFSFLKRFFRITTVFSAAVFMRVKKGSKEYLFCLVYLTIAILSLLTLSGRAGLIKYGIVLFIIEYKFSKNKQRLGHYVKLVFVGLFAVFFVQYGDMIFSYIGLLLEGDSHNFFSLMENKEKKGVVAMTEFFKSFSHCFLSIEIALRKESYRFFLVDLFSAIRSVFPGLEESAKSITHYNTYTILNREEKTIPPGLIASFIYYYSKYFIFIIGIAYGYFWKVLTVNLKKISEKSDILYPFYIGVCWEVAYTIYAGDYRLVLHSVFAYFAIWVIYISMIKVVK